MGSLAGSVGIWDGRTRTITDEHGQNGEGVWYFARPSFLAGIRCLRRASLGSSAELRQTNTPDSEAGRFKFPGLSRKREIGMIPRKRHPEPVGEDPRDIRGGDLSTGIRKCCDVWRAPGRY